MMAHDIIKKPVITEHTMDLMAGGKYTFIVDDNANKITIKNAVEQVFGVKVESVNVIRMQGKLKRMGRTQGYRSSFKKAIVKLKDTSKGIEFFEELI